MLALSFILPCYNVGRYIGDCLDSIYAQNLSEDEFEVICVNDCSTDDTREVIASKQKLHGNLILLDQPRNMYSGAARNRGLDVAQGDYIWFVDADDKLKSGMAQHLLDLAYFGKLDLLMFNFDEFCDATPDRFNQVKDIFRDTDVMTGNDFVVNEFSCGLSYLSLLWLRLFRRSLIEENKIRFSSLYISQDGPFAWETLLLAKRVKSISERCYDYRFNPHSITAKKNTAKKTAVWSFQFPVELAKLKDKVNGYVSEDIVHQIDVNIRFEVNEFAKRYKRLPKEEKSAYYKAMRNDKSWFKQFHSYLSRKNRMIYRLGCLNERLFAGLSDVFQD